MIKAEDREMQKIIESENLEVYQPQYETRPRVYYKNLYRYTTCFIAGSVAIRDTDECAEGATISLIKGSKKTIAEALSNNYGDFKLDGLTEQSGQYQLEIAYPGYEKQILNIELEGSMNLGTIFF